MKDWIIIGSPSLFPLWLRTSAQSGGPFCHPIVEQGCCADSCSYVTGFTLLASYEAVRRPCVGVLTEQESHHPTGLLCVRNRRGLPGNPGGLNLRFMLGMTETGGQEPRDQHY